MILVISDYHGREQKVLDLIDRYVPNYVLCCGDGQSKEEFYLDNNIISVGGNCDVANLDLVKIVEIEGYRILMTHGHMYQIYLNVDRLYYLAKENNCNLVLYGHTHIQKLEEYDGITFLNPGAILDDNFALISEGKFILK